MPTKRQIQYRNEVLASALENNPRKARFTLKTPQGGRCCLQVAKDVAAVFGVDISDNRGISETTSGTEVSPDGIVLSNPPQSCYVPTSVSQFFGWDDINPTLTGTLKADIINDFAFHNGKRQGLPHKKIAQLFRNQYGYKKSYRKLDVVV